MDELQPQSEPIAALDEYVRILRERFWVVLAAAVVATAVAAFVSLATTPLYRASASLVYQRTGLDTSFLGTQLFAIDSNQPRFLATTAAVLTENVSIAEAVKHELGSNRSADELMKMISASTDPGNDIVTVTAVSPYPDEAAKVANAFSDQFIAYSTKNAQVTIATAAAETKKQLDALSPADLNGENGRILKERYQDLELLQSVQHGGFSAASKAVAPTASFTPQTVRNTIMGLIVGLVLGVGLAFTLEYFDARIKDGKTLKRKSGAPVLASTPKVNGGRADDNGPQSMEN